jgi:hypothetical protein
MLRGSTPVSRWQFRVRGGPAAAHCERESGPFRDSVGRDRTGWVPLAAGPYVNAGCARWFVGLMVSP